MILMQSLESAEQTERLIMEKTGKPEGEIK